MTNDDRSRCDNNNHDHGDRNDISNDGGIHFQILNDIDSIIELKINVVLDTDDSRIISSSDVAGTRTVACALAGIPKDYYHCKDQNEMLQTDGEIGEVKLQQIKNYILKNKCRIWIFFYPAGCNCRMLVYLHRYAIQYNIIILCVNRPGKYGTSKSMQPPTNKYNGLSCLARAKKPEYSIAQLHLQTDLCDIIQVLDYCYIQFIDGILCMCAGCTFAMKFVCQYPQRLSSIFKFVSGAGWVLPADCGWNHSSTGYSLGTIVPYSVSSAVCFGMQKLGRSLIRIIPKNQMQKLFLSQLSPDELTIFEADLGKKQVSMLVKVACDNRKLPKPTVDYQAKETTVFEEFTEFMYHRQNGSMVSTIVTSATESDYADRCDVNVLLSTSTHLGINYQVFHSNILHSSQSESINEMSSSLLNNDDDHLNDTDTISRILWFHGTRDKVVPYISAKWLMKKFSTKRTTLIEFPRGSHEGVLLLLHPEIMQLAFVQ